MSKIAILQIENAFVQEKNDQLSKNTVKLFYSASLILETLRNLKQMDGEDDRKLVERIKFCKFKCVQLTKKIEHLPIENLKLSENSRQNENNESDETMQNLPNQISKKNNENDLSENFQFNIDEKEPRKQTQIGDMINKGQNKRQRMNTILKGEELLNESVKALRLDDVKSAIVLIDEAKRVLGDLS
ncbi:hypothetical protein MHBO_001179 [Bonamia ostreae]|uniref:Vta1/callose synthase N-terminal domain-containing protein n=1 Tax=Bonamia ostreae TaxID=126728 RepID=A0ABV2AIK3_9EUKA